MNEAKIVLPPLGKLEWMLLWSVLGSAILALIYGLYLVKKVLKEPSGTEKMREVSLAIEEGAMAYLRRQFK